MTETESKYNPFQEIERQEKKALDLENPETWRVGEILNVGPEKDFAKYLEDVVVQSFEDAVVEMAKNDNEDRSQPHYLKILDVVKEMIRINVRNSSKVSRAQYGADSPKTVILEKVLEVVNSSFSGPAWEKFMKKIDYEFYLDDFVELLAGRSLEIAVEKNPEGSTEYWKPYKDAYVVLTGDNQIVKKRNIGIFAIFNNEDLNKKFKILYIRKEALNILAEEEKRGKVGLINQVLEHEYQEAGHSLNPAEVATPHMIDRDPKYLEVLTVLRKRKYFH